MKRKSILCTVLVFSMILMGTAYAYWTDDLKLTTKASTGDMDVTFIDLGLYAHYAEKYGWSIIDGVGENGYVAGSFFDRGTNYNQIAKSGSIQAYYDRAETYNNVNFDAQLVDASPITGIAGPYNGANTNGSDEIVLTVNNMYPGYAQAFRTDIANVGTLAAKLSAIKFDVAGVAGVDGKEALSDAYLNSLGLALYIQREYQNDEDNVDTFKLAAALVDAGVISAADCFRLGDVDFVRLGALPESFLEGLINNTLITYPDDNRMDLFLAIAMDPDEAGLYTSGLAAERSDVADANTQNKALELTLNFLWDQFNVGVPAEVPANILQSQNLSP